MLASGEPGAPRLPRCRELIQASLRAAYAKARSELSAHTPAGAAAAGAGGGVQQGLLVVAGSLHAVAGMLALEDVAELAARARHHEQ